MFFLKKSEIAPVAELSVNPPQTEFLLEIVDVPVISPKQEK